MSEDETRRRGRGERGRRRGGREGGHDGPVSPFVFIRLTHEAFRIAIADVERASKDGAQGQAWLRETLPELRRALELHAAQEERGLFPMLDTHFDGVAASGGFASEHGEDRRLLDALEAALGADDPRAIEAAGARWALHHAEHLSHEEDVLFPLTRQLPLDDAGSVAAVRRVVDAADPAATEAFQIPWVARQLELGAPPRKLGKYLAACWRVLGQEARGRTESSLRTKLGSEAVAGLEGAGLLSGEAVV